MIKIGLTGNMGSGKSTVAKIFNVLGVPVFYTDLEAKRILNKQSIIKKLALKFGNSILDKDQKINRIKLASVVFNDSNSLKFLNDAIHPEVAKAFDNWCVQHQNSAYIIHEAAILFESGFNQFMDKIIYVYTPEEIRIKRIIKRDGSDKNTILQRMSNQWKDDKKIKKSDHRIDNGNDDLLIPQILKIHRTYSK